MRKHGPGEGSSEYFGHMSDSKSEAVARLVSAEQREAAVQLLSAAFANDAIPVAEFEQRVTRVYEAESARALQEITRDLPVATDNATSVPAIVDQSTAIARVPGESVSSVFSSIERRMQGPIPERLDIRSVVGSMELDLRRAEFPPGVTEIHVKAILGNIEIELPEHVQVEDAGSAFLGTFSVRGRSRKRRGEDAPVVRIVGRSILANVEVELDD